MGEGGAQGAAVAALGPPAHALYGDGLGARQAQKEFSQSPATQKLRYFQ